MSEIKRIPGRATSQVSIYDYPEHLNPFYEDENHKRLRFWKINSSSKGGKTGRSNSFSFSGLKDIWAFKSFTLKKKSSTLGINKTSESPPELRRVYPLGETYNTVDSRSRHTYDIGLGNSFQRNAGYRSSLQNVHSTGGDSNGFYRNDRYRSTIQNGCQTLATTSPQRDRYVYSGSVTPTPKTRYVTPQSRYGSSQTSINSTNPFDEDDTISRSESIDGVSIRKRKKRKAPQPPVTCPAVSTNHQTCTTVEEVSGKEDVSDIYISNLTAEIETFVRTHDNDEEKLPENDYKLKETIKKKEKSPPIPPERKISSTVTVHSGLTEGAAVGGNETTVTIEQVPIQKVNGDVHNHSVQVHHQTEIEILEKKNEATQVDTDNRKMNDRKVGGSRESPENNEEYPERTSHTPDVENVNIRKVNSEKQLNVSDKEDRQVNPEVPLSSPPRIIIRKATEDWECDEEINMTDDAKDKSCDNSPKTPISSEVEFILEHKNSPCTSPSPQKCESNVVVVETVIAEASNDDLKEKPKVPTKKNFENFSESSSSVHRHEEAEKTTVEDIPELKIVESTEDLTEIPTINQSSDRYKIRFVALKNFSPEPQRREVELRSQNSQELDAEDVDLPPAPPQRRRSVREIIASINKSQSLLKMNQPPSPNTEPRKAYNFDTYLPRTISAANEPPKLQPNPSNESMNRKYSELEESEKQMRKLITDMEQSSIDVPVPVVEKFDDFAVDNDETKDLFKKCVVRREKNLQSGASQEENHSSMEWNPLPKPRRSRNLTHELETETMGKTRKPKSKLAKVNPIGIPSVRDLNKELLTSEDHPHGPIASIVDQLQSVNLEEKMCGLQSLSFLCQNQQRIDEIMESDIVKTVASWLMDPCKSIRNSTAGALRNLSMNGEDVCMNLVEQDVLTPLMALLNNFKMMPEWVPQFDVEINNQMDEESDTFLQAVNLVRNLCESSIIALENFNQSEVAKTIAVAQCLLVITEDNEKAWTILSDSLQQLLSLFTINEQRYAYTLLSTLSAAICANIPEFLKKHSNLIFLTLSKTLDINHRTTLAKLSSEIPLNTNSNEIFVIEDSNSVENETDAQASLRRRKQDMPTETEVKIQDVGWLLEAQRVAVETITNICVVEDEDESDDASGGASDDMSDAESVQDYDYKSSHSNLQSDKLPADVLDAIKSLGLVEKMWLRAQRLAENVAAILKETEHPLMTKVIKMQISSLLCLHNLCNLMTTEDLGGPRAIYGVWLDLAQQVFHGTQNMETLEASTSLMRAALDHLKHSPELFSTMTSSDLKLMLHGVETCTKPEIRANWLRMLGVLCCLLPENLVKNIITFIVDVSLQEQDAWTLSEAMDALMDIFSENDWKQIVSESNLVTKVKQLEGKLRTQTKQQKRDLGDRYRAVSTVLLNLSNFHKYMQATQQKSFLQKFFFKKQKILEVLEDQRRFHNKYLDEESKDRKRPIKTNTDPDPARTYKASFELQILF
ncbi:HEAT repeat-containing protein 3, partial [Pseudolycoriella hygida]